MVDKGSPADGQVAVGDVIVGISGQLAEPNFPDWVNLFYPAPSYVKVWGNGANFLLDIWSSSFCHFNFIFCSSVIITQTVRDC